MAQKTWFINEEKRSCKKEYKTYRGEIREEGVELGSR